MRFIPNIFAFVALVCVYIRSRTRKYGATVKYIWISKRENVFLVFFEIEKLKVISCPANFILAEMDINLKVTN